MKKLLTVLGCFAAAMVLCAGESLDAAKTFEADYRSRKIAPVVAKGNAAAKVVLGTAPEFSAQGLVVGKGKASLRYDTAGNLNSSNGAIEILFENTALDWNDKSKLILIQSLGKDLTFYIYKHSTDGLGAFFGNRAVKKWSAFPRAIPKRLGDKKLYHLVINYSDKEVQCFVDGKLMRSIKSTTALGAFGKHFYVGPAGQRFGRDAVATIAKVAAYNRPLAKEEVADLASQNAGE